MSDYETAKVPPATPPVIDPDVDPKTAAEMAADGETEGDVLADETKPDEIDIESEQAMRPAMENGRDGEGELAADAATLLPPD